MAAHWSSGYAHVSNPTFAAGMSQGVLGVGWPRPSVLLAMFFGRARGLFYVAPVLLLAAWGLGRGLRQPPTRRRALTAVAMLAAFALMNAGYYMWWGGAALGPRHIIPALPFLALGLAWLPWTSRSCQLLFAVALALSLSNQLAAVAVSPLADANVDVLFGHIYPALLRNQVAILPGRGQPGHAAGPARCRQLAATAGVVGAGHRDHRLGPAPSGILRHRSTMEPDAAAKPIAAARDRAGRLLLAGLVAAGLRGQPALRVRVRRSLDLAGQPGDPGAGELAAAARARS